MAQPQQNCLEKFSTVLIFSFSHYIKQTTHFIAIHLHTSTILIESLCPPSHPTSSTLTSTQCLSSTDQTLLCDRQLLARLRASSPQPLSTKNQPQRQSKTV